MNVRMQIAPGRDASTGSLSFQLSLAEIEGSGGTASSHFETLGQVTGALRSIGFDEPSIRFAEKTLKTGLTYTKPDLELSGGDLRRLRIQQMRRLAERGRER
jgi:hypothetical protein